MSDYILTSNGELYHYGVKGMKWGVRRAQRKLNRAAKTAAKQAKRRKNLANDYKRVLKDIKSGDYKKFGYPSAERAKYDIPLNNDMIRSEINIAKNWTKIHNKIMKMSINDVAEAKALIEKGKQYADYMDWYIQTRIKYESKQFR